MSQKRRIAEIEEHRVSSGETLERLAENKGLTWEEIARFNWQTTDPEVVNERLRTVVGCTRSPQDSRFHVFDDADDPGIILIPQTWRASGLPTDTCNKIYVRNIEPEERLLTCCRIPGLTFEFDQSFIRPEHLDKLQDIDTALSQYPDAKVLIYGHTDRCGPPQYNKDLSDRRAESAYGFVAHKPEVWERLYTDEEWGVRVVQKILTHLGHETRGIDGVVGDNTRAAMRSFLGLSADAEVENDAGFRERLFAAYMNLGFPDAVADDRFVHPKFVGCGEFNPLGPPNRFEQMNGGRGRRPGNEPNRRVIFYLFDRPPADVPCVVGDINPCNEQITAGGVPDNQHFTCPFYVRLAQQCRCECDREPQPLSSPDSRVRPWEIRLEQDDLDDEVERVCLEAEEADYNEYVERADAELSGGFLSFRFPEGPEGLYRVVARTKGTEYLIWKGIYLPEDAPEASSAQAGAGAAGGGSTDQAFWPDVSGGGE